MGESFLEKVMVWKLKVFPKLKRPSQNFPGGPVVKTPHFHCRGHGFDPSSSGKFRMPHGVAKKKKKKTKGCP